VGRERSGRNLFYRLNQIYIQLPPLRERQEDIPVLARHFLDQANQVFKKAIRGFSPDAEALLIAYAWPGNARELRNVIERVVLLEMDDLVLPAHLPPEISGDRGFASPALADVGALFPSPLADVERRYIQAVLDRVGGNKTRAAGILQITRQTLRARLDESR